MKVDITREVSKECLGVNNCAINIAVIIVPAEEKKLLMNQEMPKAGLFATRRAAYVLDTESKSSRVRNVKAKQS